MPDKLYFRCPCGYWSRDLGAFHDHAMICRAERARARAGVRTGRDSRRPEGWRVGHYLSRMLGYPLSPPGTRDGG
jgi:hypothetical protein